MKEKINKATEEFKLCSFSMKRHNRKVNLSHFFIQLPIDALGGEGRPLLTKLSEERYKAKISYKYTSLGT